MVAVRDATAVPSGWYAYNAVGTVYHTRNCSAVTAHDTLTRVVPTKTELPERVDGECGHCQRIREREPGGQRLETLLDSRGVQQ